MIDALKRHWPEYMMEAAGLGLFMVSASVFGVVLEHPASPVHAALPDATLRRALMGCAMGLTAIALIYSPWGRRSGAHLNPSVTLTFWSLGTVAGADALLYVAFQFAGGAAGVAAAHLALGRTLAHPAVGFVVTRPGAFGPGAAFAAEGAISFVLMLVVLTVGNTARLAAWTGVFAGVLVSLWITIEAPISGMSMNPARTFGSDWNAGLWPAFWIYLTAPPLAMLAAGQTHRWARQGRRIWCAKLHHAHGVPCPFRCAFPGGAPRTAPARASA